MRKMFWCLSSAGIVSFGLMCWAADYGARHPDTWVGRCVINFASLGAHCNPFAGSGAAPTPGPAAEIPHAPQPLKHDDAPIIDVPEVVGTIKLEVELPLEQDWQPTPWGLFPLWPPADPSHMPRVDVSAELLTPPCRERPLPERMPYAGEEVVLLPDDPPATPATDRELQEQRPVLRGPEHLPNMQEDPARHYHYPGCPYIGGPYPIYLPRTLDMPKAQTRPDHTPPSWNLPVGPLGLSLPAWLFHPER
jgi:hypothetical protein